MTEPKHGDDVMQTKYDGGSAFPLPGDDTRLQGMSLRDYFAAKAMQASIAKGGSYSSWGDLTTDAYEIADAMLKARSQ